MIINLHNNFFQFPKLNVLCFFFVGNKTFFFLFLLFSHSFFDVEKTKKREREKNYFVDLKEYQEKKLIYPDFLLETNQKNGEYLKKTIF